MSSFLLTKKMSSELAARVEQSLHGNARERLVSSRPRKFRGLIRLLVALGVGCGIWFAVSTYRQSRREVETLRSDLRESFTELNLSQAEKLRARLNSLSRTLIEEGTTARPEVLLTGLKDMERLHAALKGPLLYARLDQVDIQANKLRPLTANVATENTAQTVQLAPLLAPALHGALAGSEIDGFAQCFLMRPVDTKESSLLKHLGQSAELTASRTVEPKTLHQAYEFLTSSFREEVQAAEHMSELEKLKRRLLREDLRDKRQGLQARYFLFVIDEPLAPGNHADFDGEGAHMVRLGVVDLDSRAVLLRVARKVSPDWISEKRRLAYSRPLDSCRLAFDLWTELRATP